MTLSPSQLRALTGKVRRADQEAWLLERRIPYRWDGVRLLVSCSLVDAWLGGKELAVSREPNLAALERDGVQPTEIAGILEREWQKFVVGPDLHVVERGASHPVDCGIYFLFNDELLVYIGLSLGISMRMNQHAVTKHFTHYGAVYVPPELLLPIEVAYIHALTPPLNVKKDYPQFKAHEKMVEAIKERWEAEC